MCFVLSELIFFPILSIKAENLKTIERLSSECFYSKNRESCKIAIDRIAVFKSSSSIQENYSCHTRLLGLESKLLMSLIDLKKRRDGFENYDEIKRICSTSFWFKSKLLRMIFSKPLNFIPNVHKIQIKISSSFWNDL